MYFIRRYIIVIYRNAIILTYANFKMYINCHCKALLRERQ